MDINSSSWFCPRVTSGNLLFSSGFPHHLGSPEWLWISSGFPHHLGSPEWLWISSGFPHHLGSPEWLWISSGFPHHLGSPEWLWISSGFPHHLGSPERLWISLFEFVLSSASSSFNPALSMSLLHESFHLVFCLPLRLFSGTRASNDLTSLGTSKLRFESLPITSWASSFVCRLPEPLVIVSINSSAKASVPVVSRWSLVLRSCFFPNKVFPRI